MSTDFFDAWTKWTDPTVDIVAIAAIAAIVYAYPDGGLAQVAIGGVTSIAVGKRYIERMKNAN